MNIPAPQMLRTPLQDVPPFATELLLRTLVGYTESPTQSVPTPSNTISKWYLHVVSWKMPNHLAVFSQLHINIPRYKSQRYRFSVRKLRCVWRTNSIGICNESSPVIPNLYHPCIVYSSTFTIEINHIQVNIPVPYMAWDKTYIPRRTRGGYWNLLAVQPNRHLGVQILETTPHLICIESQKTNKIKPHQFTTKHLHDKWTKSTSMMQISNFRFGRSWVGS